MSDGKEHILLLGDTHEAAKWVGWGKARLRLLRATDQLARNYRPKENVLVRVERWGGVEKVIINVEPIPVPSFVGYPHDPNSFYGFGFDPEDPEGPETVIGDAKVGINRATLVRAGAKGAWIVERFPHYAGRFGGEPEWGNNVWSGGPSLGAPTLSWKGLQGRFPQVLLTNEEIYAGFNCQDFGFAYIGTQLTYGKYCTAPSADWYKRECYTSIGLPDGATNSFDGGNDLVKAFGQYVYRDGFRYFNAGSGATVMGAAIRTVPRTGERQFLCVIANRHIDIGVYEEYLYYAPANDIQNGKRALIAKYKNDFYDVNDGIYYVRPETNCMSWNFSENGQFAVTMRLFYNKDDGYFENVACYMDPDDVIADDSAGLYQLDQLWNSHFAAPPTTSTANSLEFSGEYVVTVDVDGNEIVYAYAQLEFNRVALGSGAEGYVDSDTTCDEYIYFSKWPEKKIPIFRHRSNIVWEQANSGREYCHKDLSVEPTYVSILGCIDARYGVVTLWKQRDNGYRVHKEGINPSLVFVYKLIPSPVSIYEHCECYVGGELIESTPELRWEDTNFGFPVEEVTCPDGQVVLAYVFNPFVTTDNVAHPWSLNFFGCYASSVIAARVDEAVTDLAISFKAYNNGFGTINRLLRVDRVSGQVLVNKDLSKVLTIDEDNPYTVLNNTKVFDEGAYGYIGLI